MPEPIGYRACVYAACDQIGGVEVSQVMRPRARQTEPCKPRVMVAGTNVAWVERTPLVATHQEPHVPKLRSEAESCSFFQRSASRIASTATSGSTTVRVPLVVLGRPNTGVAPARTSVCLTSRQWAKLSEARLRAPARLRVDLAGYQRASHRKARSTNAFASFSTQSP